MTIVKLLIALVAVLLGGFVLVLISWLTGGSYAAYAAGVFLLVFLALWVASVTKILTLPPFVRTMFGWAVVMFIGVIFWISIAHWWDNRPKKSGNHNHPPAGSTDSDLKSATVLMVDRLTPLCDSINYSYELDTQGDSISMLFHTVRGDTTVKYLGKGEDAFPAHTRVEGLVCMKSLNPEKAARVKIRRKTITPY